MSRKTSVQEERPQVKRRDLRWRGAIVRAAISGGGKRPQVEKNDFRWRGDYRGWRGGNFRSRGRSEVEGSDGTEVKGSNGR